MAIKAVSLLSKEEAHQCNKSGPEDDAARANPTSPKQNIAHDFWRRVATASVVAVAISAKGEFDASSGAPTFKSVVLTKGRLHDAGLKTNNRGSKMQQGAHAA